MARQIVARLLGPVVLLLAVGPCAVALADEPFTGLRVTSPGLTTLALAWDLPATHYSTAVLTVGGPAPGGGQTGSDDWIGQATSRVAYDLVCGSDYTITGLWSDQPSQPTVAPATLQARTSACTKPPPAAPAGLVATPSDTDIAFGADGPPAGVTGMFVSLTGPGWVGASTQLPAASSYTPTVVCGESYTYALRWLDDENQVSPAAEIAATALDCPPPDGDGPANLHVSVSASSVTFSWDAPASGSGVWLARTSRTGNAPFFYLSRTTTHVSNSHPACGTAYPFAVQWVWTEGTVSEATNVTARTPDCPPAVVQTGGVTDIRATTAVLRGSLTANGSATRYDFEYGVSPAYGSTTAVTDGGDRTTSHSVRADVGGLAPSTTYHYRLVAENAAGTVYGADQAFSTTSAAATFVPSPVVSATPHVQRTVCTVPHLKALKLRAAKTRLGKAHCRLGHVTRRKAARARRGRVLASRPAAGRRTTGRVALVVGR